MLNVFHGACFKEQILDVKIYFWFIMDICGIVSSSCACMCFIIRTEIYIPLRQLPTYVFIQTSNYQINFEQY